MTKSESDSTSSHVSFRILFVCTGNSCRSPIAEGILRARLCERYDDRVAVDSAGTMGLVDNEATPHAIRVAGDEGVDISDHHSQALNAELVAGADLIFGLAQEHADYIRDAYPEQAERVFVLRSYGNQAKDTREQSIPDPIGGSLRVYKKCRDEIVTEIDRILPLLYPLIDRKLNSDR